MGLIADLKNIPTHQTVENGITILKNLMHRGATGGDPETGDGAGILVSLPDEFFRKVVKEKLPEYGKYGVAVIFGGEGIEDDIEKIITEKCGEIICWRNVPVDEVRDIDLAAPVAVFEFFFDFHKPSVIVSSLLSRQR